MAPRKKLDEVICALIPALGEWVEGELADASGVKHEGFFVEGSMTEKHLARAFVALEPQRSLVTSIIAAVEGLNGWVDEKRAKAHFDAMFATARLRPGKVSTRRGALVGERLIFDFEGALVDEDIGQILARGQPDLELAYMEFPSGLFDVAEVVSPVFTLDQKRRFCFRRDFLKTAKPRRRTVSIAGIEGKLPAHTWKETNGVQGVAFVRDDVLHHFALRNFDEAAREAMLSSLRLRGTLPDALIEPRRHNGVRSMFHPMPDSLGSVRKRFEKQKKKGQR
jgi:hypothetical protein